MRAVRIAVCAVVVLCVAVAAAYASGGSGLPLTQRVLKAGQFAGMKPSKAPTVTYGAAAWAQGNKMEAAELRKWGFVAGVGENLVTPGNPNRYGLSLVTQFSSAAGAKAALKADSTTNGPWTYFKDPAIPGAIGFEELSGSEGGINVGFTIGPYGYLVGAGWQQGAKNAVSRTPLLAAALLIYDRVH